MDSGDRNDVGFVFGVKVIQIGLILEVVGVDFAAFNYMLGCT